MILLNEMMDRVRLLEALQKENLMQNKTGIVIPDMGHNGFPQKKITEEIQKWERTLVPAVAV